MRRVGAAIATVEELPVAPLDRRAFQPAQADTGLGYAAALLADVLAPRVRQAREEIVEVGVAVVAPMHLHRAAHQETVFLQHPRLLVARDEHEQRPHVAPRLR